MSTGRKRKTKKTGSGYEVLQKCVTVTSTASLLDYVNKSSDEYAALKLAGLSENEIIAKEFKFHCTCYKDITRKPTADDLDEIQEEESNSQNECFQKVKSVIQNKVIENGDFIKLSCLAEMYGQYQQQYQQQLGLEKVGVQNRHLKARLKNTFGNQVSFHQKANGLPEIIYNTEKLNKVRLYDPVEVVKEAGRIVCKELLECPDIYSEWPPTEKELLKNKFEMSSFTGTLLLSILSKNPSKTEKNSRLVDSIAQDLLYNASNGRSMFNLVFQSNGEQDQLVCYVG